MSIHKSALVTGGSGSIGACIVEFLLRNNWHVVTTYRKNEKKIPDNSMSVKVDFTNPRKAVERLDNKMDSSQKQQLRLIVHAAGTTRDQLLVNMSEEDWQNPRRIHLDTAFKLATKFGDYLHTESTPNDLPSSHFVLITSRSGLHGRSGQSNYAAMKSGLLGFAKSLAQEWVPDVRVNVIQPPLTESTMTRSMDQEVLNTLVKSSLGDSLSSPEETVKTLRLLLESDDVNGQLISADSRIESSW